MQFEHLIEINSATEPGIDPLSRATLWRGLVVRAEKPELFVIGLDRCALTPIDDGHLQRRLTFGAYEVDDRVRLIPMDAVIYDVAPTATSRGARM